MHRVLGLGTVDENAAATHVVVVEFAGDESREAVSLRVVGRVGRTSSVAKERGISAPSEL